MALALEKEPRGDLVEVTTTGDSIFSRRPEQKRTGQQTNVSTGAPLGYWAQRVEVSSRTATNWRPAHAAMIQPAPAVNSAHTFRIAGIKNELRRYTNLPNGWDGEGGVAPPKRAVLEAITFLDLLPPNMQLPKPMVEGDGEVALYWKGEDRYLEIGFKGDGSVDYYGEDEELGVELMSADPFDGSHIDPGLMDFIRHF